jgi:hypothetical protein
MSGGKGFAEQCHPVTTAHDPVVESNHRQLAGTNGSGGVDYGPCVLQSFW